MDPRPGRASGSAGRVAAIAALSGLLAMSAAGCGAAAGSRPLAFGHELQQILDDNVRASNGLGVSAAVISSLTASCKPSFTCDWLSIPVPDAKSGRVKPLTVLRS